MGNDLAGGMRGLPSGDEFAAELAAVGTGAAGAGVDVKEGGSAHGRMDAGDGREMMIRFIR
jgi:hypothetical protein